MTTQEKNTTTIQIFVQDGMGKTRTIEVESIPGTKTAYFHAVLKKFFERFPAMNADRMRFIHGGKVYSRNSAHYRIGECQTIRSWCAPGAPHPIWFPSYEG